MSFSKQIAAFNEKAKSRATKVTRGIALDLFSRIILRTPVDTGRLRGNWFVSIEEPIKNTTEGFDKSGASALTSALSTVNKMKLGQKIYLTNNLPYASAIENGHSQGQAPQGMVKVTINEFKRIVKVHSK